MGKTFGDYMREQGGKQPEKEAIPVDECVLTWAEEQDEIARDNVGDETEYLAYVTSVNREEMLAVLGDEAEYALCETCHVSVPVDQGVTCEGCHQFFADHGKGRNNCWKNHNCGTLVTSRGQLVNEGDVLVYPSHPDEFTVMKMEGTWVRGGHARGLRRRGSHEMPIIPRLMYHKENTTK